MVDASFGKASLFNPPPNSRENPRGPVGVPRGCKPGVGTAAGEEDEREEDEGGRGRERGARACAAAVWEEEAEEAEEEEEPDVPFLASHTSMYW